jgi:hypothetical protein
LKKTITINVKVRNTEIHADFQVIFSDKGIDLGFQMYGFMTANGISFGSDLLAECQTFSQHESKIGMA